MRIIRFICLFSLMLAWVAEQQTTVFRFKIPPRKPDHREARLSEFLRYPESMPIHIPIPVLERSISTISEMLVRRGSKHHNPSMGLYNERTKPPRRPYPWVEEPTVFDLIKQFNADAKKQSDASGSKKPADPIDLITICSSWEEPPRLYTRLQVRNAKTFNIDPCKMLPWYCMERCELVPTIGNAPFVPPKCAAPYKGMDIFSGYPEKKNVEP
ncbi:uncharacterized protein GGS22DRAFT_192179 [Annulohypoxylon maeteangense]|uniref:uncharacterized protein n=1 Tax=Annulohypoxylon maeteangense TaxID=1927788 RepID=UPI0020073BCC|nr:uncharacterized protein GGS22DRAFT_192179 [Annulohypoxylon maeteangense]KAI0881545.1 hypothetical protein GGS22DRAFT_192179 [Annulohypoxylon maeteangense]